MAGRKRLRALLAGIAMRVVAVGCILLLVGLLLGDFRSFFRSRPASRTTVEVPEDHAQADPGWPHRRGPHYDAVSDETELADSWPPEGPPVLWMREIGRGYSGIIAVGNRVFTQRQTLSNQSVLCLAAESGEPIWEHRYGWPYEAAGMYPGPRATPTWHDGKIYFAGPRGSLGCLRAGDGRLLWSVNVHEKFDGQGTDFGYACSPLVLDGKVIMPLGGPDASVVALDAQNGSTLWTAGDEPASYCSALPITFDGRPYVVAFLQNALAVHDLQTGRLMCLEKFSTGYDEHAAAPLSSLAPRLRFALTLGATTPKAVRKGPQTRPTGTPPREPTATRATRPEATRSRAPIAARAGAVGVLCFAE